MKKLPREYWETLRAGEVKITNSSRKCVDRVCLPHPLQETPVTEHCLSSAEMTHSPQTPRMRLSVETEPEFQGAFSPHPRERTLMPTLCILLLSLFDT